LDARKVDSALATGIAIDEPWKPIPVVALRENELVGTAGSKYTPCPTLMGLKCAFGRHERSRVALAGLPCQIWAVRKMQLMSHERPAWVDAIELTIGIFCHSLFHHSRFLSFIRKQGIDPATISKFVIKKGRFSVILREGKNMVNMSAIELAKGARLDLECCLHCTDYLAEFADISVGGFGSPEGWSTVITRSEKGEKLMNEALKSGFLDAVDKRNELPQGILKLAGLKRRKARKPYIPDTYERVFRQVVSTVTVESSS
jgi:coenzyme F420 hydrogenase subunit beta